MMQAKSTRAVRLLPWGAFWAGVLLLTGTGFSPAAAQDPGARWAVAADPSMDMVQSTLSLSASPLIVTPISISAR